MNSLKDRTSASFGFEWAKFSDIYTEYEDNFLSYILPITGEFFKGKFVLDAGCGAGRHAYFAAKYGAKNVIAFDLSMDAVHAAMDNLFNVRATVKQADIYDLPESWNGAFDFAMSIGVLHHLPNPQLGFQKLIPLLKPSGTISIWVYARKDNKLALYLYEPLRKITTRIPHKVLYYLAWFPAVLMQVSNWLHLPLFSYYARFPFRTKWNDSFDVFSAPSAKYYTLEEIRAWFEQAGLKDIVISYRMLNGKAKGIRAMGVK